MKLLVFLLLPFSLFAQSKEEIKPGPAKAAAFVNSLNDSQRQKALFHFEDMNRYEWHFVPPTDVMRYGVAVKDLNETQKSLLYELMKVFLSKDGYARTKDIMSFEYILKELEPNNPARIPENYFAAVYGDPAKDSIWGWKFSGHHVALNFTIVNGQLAFAPFFFGSNPGEVKQGPKKGMRIMRAEEDLGFKLVNSLNEEQRKKAIFQPDAIAEIVTRNIKQVKPLDPVGIFVKDMAHEQKAVLNQLILAYLNNMPAAVAKKRMANIVKEDMEVVEFGWAGATEPGKPHYYRVQGKTFLIEFDNTQNNANHIHTVWRDFNGDFGEDLLQEHYQHAPHHHHQ